MNLPNYFLADLPPEASLTAAIIGEACQTLKRNRSHYLANRSTASLIKTISQTAECWLMPDYPFRQLLMAKGPETTGFSRSLLLEGLDTFFSQLTADNLHELVAQEFGHAQRLDSMVSTVPEQRARQAAIALGPELLVHITGGVIPNPSILSIVLGILARAAQFVKCASGTSLLPRLFAHSLYDSDPKLAACLEIAEWPGGTHALENTLFTEADCITATGSDETLAAIRAQVPHHKRFVGYGHKVSFGFITHEVLSAFGARKVAAGAAIDVTAWNQLGCLSPHVFYVESGGAVNAVRFAELLSEELARREEAFPRGPIPPEHAAVITSRRAFYRVRADSSEETRLWHSPENTDWTVVCEADPRFQLSCLNRFIYVKAVSDLTETLQNAEQVRGKVSTVGLEAQSDRAEQLALTLARWGVTRVCPLGQMQNPPITWRRDGRPPLADLVTWTNWEM
ncbi:MAG TPA: acyl-CoA reductase [Candidatus Saccharimonadales bacterium]|nr:acyl-CoA reductase [Candidatus Saccharimonadales bacterium]